MPKTPMHKHDRPTRRENQIGFAGQTRATQPVPQTLCMKRLSQKHFRLGVFASDTRHHATAGRCINNICHSAVMFIARCT